MPLTRTLLPALCLWLMWGNALALPDAFRAEFTVTSNGTRIGRTVWTLEPQEDGRYLFRSVTRATGLLSLLFSGERTEESLWTLHDGRVRPLEYRYVRTGRKSRTVEVFFDWAAGQAVNRHGDDSWRLDVEPGTHDKLVYLLALMRDLARGASELRYTIADGGHLKEYRVQRQGRERIDTAAGAFDTVKVHRRDPKGKRHTTLWAAEGLDYLPVRVEQEERDGDVVAMTLDSLEGLGKD